MAALFKHEEVKVQLAVLDAFDYLGSAEIIPFLIKYIHQATGFQLQSALNVLGNQGDPHFIYVFIPFTQHKDPSIQRSALSALKMAGLSRVDLHGLSADFRYINHLFDLEST